MNATVRMQIEEVQRMKVGALKDEYQKVFGEESRSGNRQFLIRRIAWRLQAQAEGGLSERARRRAMEIANEADLRLTAPKSYREPGSEDARTSVSQLLGTPDERLPMPGSELTRKYKGKLIVVRVLDRGFEYDGRVHRSLSAIAHEVTGTRWNGFLFFGCGGKEVRHAAR
jgi:hypothetical protein